MDEDPFQCIGEVDGIQCALRATQEDGLCDDCRETSVWCIVWGLAGSPQRFHAHATQLVISRL